MSRETTSPGMVVLPEREPTLSERVAALEAKVDRVLAWQGRVFPVLLVALEAASLLIKELLR